MSANTTFPTLLEMFFRQRLMQQKRASAHTLASYRDTFCLLLRYAEQKLHKAPSGLALEDLDAPLIGAFLAHLQENRGTSARVVSQIIPPAISHCVSERRQYEFPH